MRRLVLGGSAVAVVALVFVLDPPVVQTLLLSLAVAVAAIPWLARPVRRLVDGLGRRIVETPSRLRSLDRWERVVVLSASAAFGLMVMSVLGPWIRYGWGGGFDLPRSASTAGWIVMVAGVAGIALVVLTAPSSLGGGCTLVAGIVGVAAVLDVRDAVGAACPQGPDGMNDGMNTLGIFCMAPELGWGFQLATVASLALCSIGAAWLVVAGVRGLHGRHSAAPL